LSVEVVVCGITDKLAINLQNLAQVSFLEFGLQNQNRLSYEQLH